MRIAFVAATCAAAIALGAGVNAQTTMLANDHFRAAVDNQSGVITSIKLPNDVYDTDYIAAGRNIGDVTIRYRTGGGDWVKCGTAASSDSRTVRQVDPNLVTVAYAATSAETEGIRAITLDESYRLSGDSLTWTLRFKNTTKDPIELGDIGLPLQFNNSYRDSDSTTIMTKRVIRHSLVSGDGSFMFLTRCNGKGPYLVITPNEGAHLEYFTQRRGPYTVFIHAKAQALSIDTDGTWRLPITSRMLAPAGTPGDEVAYSFKLQWARDYDAVRETLVKEGLISVTAAPGMVVPQKMPTMFSLATTQPINSVKAEFPKSTVLKYAGKKGDNNIYRVQFSNLGENMLTVDFGKGRKMYLEFFCTQPLETVIQKRAAFIVNKQQVRDPSKWYDGLFSIWDMEHKALRNPDDTGGLRDYMVGGSDDPTNCKAPLVAEKNVSLPVQSEIDALEHYAEHFLWGGLQRTDTETPYPYAIYGIDNWYVNRNSPKGFGSGTGKEHLWRSFDYPPIFYFYLNMYKIAKLYPNATKYLDAAGYLDRAFKTAKAYYELAYSLKVYNGWYEDYAYKTGVYNELCLPELMDILRQEGRPADAEWLRNEWEKKVKYFIYDDPYPYASEFPFDTTAYESTQALARYGVEHDMAPDRNLWVDKNTGQSFSHPKVSKEDARDFMERQMAANIADRGWLETSYYHLGSDIRGGGNAGYQLSYMTQMGGWAVMDYALHYAARPVEYLRLGYASFLGSWALVNCGDAASNYGYWYPGPENDGAAGWGFEPQKISTPWDGISQGRGPWTYDGEIDHGFMGGLRCARTVLVDDPIFGIFAYGGGVSLSRGAYTIIPMDGLRQRFNMLNVDPRLSVELDRDGFTKITAYTAGRSLRKLCFTLENRTGDAHKTHISMEGMPAGEYIVIVDKSAHGANISSGTSALTLDIPARKTCGVTIAPASKGSKPGG